MQCQSLSRSYLTTDSQSASLSWCQATIWTRVKFFSLLQILFRQSWVCYFMTPSLNRRRDLLAWPAQSLGTRDHVLLSEFFRLPKPGGPSPRICIPQGQYNVLEPILHIKIVVDRWDSRNYSIRPLTVHCPLRRLFSWNPFEALLNNMAGRKWWWCDCVLQGRGDNRLAHESVGVFKLTIVVTLNGRRPFAS
jgi:hypothetical protein